MKQNCSVTCLGLALSLFALAGCVTTRPVLNMTYHSDPEGATLYEGAQLRGHTPATLNYLGGEARFRQNQCVLLNPMQVRWASGAVSSVSNLQMCPAMGWAQQYLFVRPNVPGAEFDANFALQQQGNAIQLQRNGVLQQQADAQDATAVAEFLRAQKAH